MKKKISYLLLSLLVSCKPPVAQDPVGAINGLVKEYGYIGFQNPLQEARTGTLLAGRPTALSFVANHRECFPAESVERFEDFSNIEKKYTYTFQGGLGFLSQGNPVVSGGINLKSNVFVDIELNGIVIEYMSSIAITEWYNNGMSETCKSYLNDVGFIIQSLLAEKMTISLRDESGVAIGLDANNVQKFLKFNLGVNWHIVDSYKVVIDSPKYVGYQLGRLRLEDNGRTLYRASKVVDDKFVFESIGIFKEESLLKVKSKQFTAPSI